MMSLIIYGMVFLGSALMVYNIYSFAQYLKRLLQKDYWESGRWLLYFPLILLIMFLCGYLVVGIFGKPDIIMSGILFFGSVYVTVITIVLKTITRKVEENERLESELRAAEDSSKAKTRFLSRMSHEIRTPMNAIVGLNTLALKNPDLPPDARQQLEKVDTSAQHMLDLINDILDMSRIESGHVELKNEPFPMRGMLSQVNSIIQTQCDEKGLKYDYLQLGELEERYMGDVLKLRQVLINILGNAVKFTPEGGTVQLQVRAMTHDTAQCPLRFTIRDTGQGMDAEYLEHIFEPFSQEDDTSTSRYGGTGLGMSITKGLVELMGGEIRVESEKGKGTTFIIDLVLREPNEEELQQAAREHDAAAAKKAAAAEVAKAGKAAVKASAEGTAKAGEAAPADIPEKSAAPEAASAAEAAAKKSAAAAPAAVPDEEEAPLAGRHILFAEDIEINADILMDLLELEDITCDWAQNGQIAVDKFTQSDPFTYDAILMDLRMPVMDGLTATRAIRKLDREDAATIPIIALTANAFEEDVQQCLDAGMDAHVAKPVDSDILCEKLRQLILEG